MKCRFVHKVLAMSLLFAAVTVGNVVMAQEQSESTSEQAQIQDTDTQQDAQQAESSSEEPEPSSTKPAPSAAANGEFIPSEEISEDLPVSFPVDI